MVKSLSFWFLNQANIMIKSLYNCISENVYLTWFCSVSTEVNNEITNILHRVNCSKIVGKSLFLLYKSYITPKREKHKSGYICKLDALICFFNTRNEWWKSCQNRYIIAFQMHECQNTIDTYNHIENKDLYTLFKLISST